MLGRVLMDSTGVQIKHSSVLTENCPFESSSSGESVTAERSHSISVDRRNSDEIKAMDAATSKKARIGLTNLSEPKRVVEKPVLMNVPAEGENGDIGISGVKKPNVSSLDYWSCSSEDEEGSIDDDSCIDEIYFKESVRKKLQFLSYMVGMDCSNPVEVLSEVVRVLKQLNGGWWCNSNAKLN